MIVLPQRLRLVENIGTLAHNLETLWENRFLIVVWLRYNIQSRYSQSILGVLWILLIPLSTGLVLSMALTIFLRIQLDVPFIVFFFSAYTVYNIFGQGINNSTQAITGSMGLLNQVNFPREILVLVALGEALIDTFLMFIAMLVINALHGFFSDSALFFADSDHHYHDLSHARADAIGQFSERYGTRYSAIGGDFAATVFLSDTA